MSVKTERIESSLIKEISYILETEVKNKDIRFVTITGAKLASDLSFCKVYFTVLDEDKKNETLKALNEAGGFIRHELRERVDIRQIPLLSFVYDESISYGQRIENIIDNLNKE